MIQILLFWWLFWLLRTTITLALVLMLLYWTGAIDEILRLVFENFFADKFRLRVCARCLRTRLTREGCIIEILDPHVLAPPLEQDPRWNCARIMSARRMEIAFLWAPCLWGLLISRGTIVTMEHIHIDGIDGWIEGYEATTTYAAGSELLLGWRDYSHLQLNLTLIGGEFEPSKARHPRRATGDAPAITTPLYTQLGAIFQVIDSPLLISFT